jgi:lipopolysaccharide transport system ATP-binding protein
VIVKVPDTVIRAEGLGKKYVIGHVGRGAGYATLREAVVARTRCFVRRASDVVRGRPIVAGDTFEDVWALRDVNFAITRGDAVGIVGRNGAGKSTLLKLLSRITEPSAGRITIKGRVGSLLEVGTGFHPELSGRENIYLNGTILGMTRRDIDAKFDQIVAFAEVERYLDTPVKRYSSGMYVRLAFAVAAHLEPQILVVDEVLAVGDAAFQKKCLGRMSEVSQEGRTVLFVSHNMGAVTQLCSKALLLQAGQVVEYSDDVDRIVRRYVTAEGDAVASEWRRTTTRFDNEWFSPSRLYLGTEQGTPVETGAVGVNEDCHLYVEGDCSRTDPALQVGIAVYNSEGLLLYWSFSTDVESRWATMHAGPVRLRTRLPAFFLNEGTYRIDLGIALFHRQWICEPGRETPTLTLDVIGGFTSSRYWTEKRPGVLAPALPWELTR